jgi:hypothetical protein
MYMLLKTEKTRRRSRTTKLVLIFAMVALKQAGFLKSEGGVADHARTPLSKTEINLYRLLKSCERQAAELDDAILQQDLRFANVR